MVVFWNYSFPQRQLRIGSNSAQPQSPAVRRSEYHRNGGERLCSSIQLGSVQNRRLDEPGLCATAIHKLSFCRYHFTCRRKPILSRIAAKSTYEHGVHTTEHVYTGQPYERN